MSLKNHSRGQLMTSIKVGRSNLKKKDGQLRDMAERMRKAEEERDENERILVALRRQRDDADARVVELEAEIERLHLMRIAEQNPDIDIDALRRIRAEDRKRRPSDD